MIENPFLEAMERRGLKAGDDAIFELAKDFSPEVVLEAAAKLGLSGDAAWRKVSAGLLGDLGLPEDYALVDESVSLLKELTSKENEPEVLACLINALGSRRSPEALETLVSFADHFASQVRRAVAANVPFLAMPHNALEIVGVLRDLSQDHEDEVREWATFGLASQLYYSDAELRAPVVRPIVQRTLVERSGDRNPRIRGEALLGMALRRLHGTVERVNEELSGYSVATSTVDAAKTLGDPYLIPALRGLEAWWEEDPERLAEAVLACTRG